VHAAGIESSPLMYRVVQASLNSRHDHVTPSAAGRTLALHSATAPISLDTLPEQPEMGCSGSTWQRPMGSMEAKAWLLSHAR
jgi:hypothetical protein